MVAHTPITRRRFLRIAAAGAAAAALPFPLLSAGPDKNMYRWRGIVLGAEASMQIYLPGRNQAAALVHRSLEEIKRLERIFSLHDPGSSLSLLNRHGRLDSPPAELVELLLAARRFSALTGGAFDVTVQPLWNCYARHFAAQPQAAEGPLPGAIDAALALVDYRKLAISREHIGFEIPGMQVTLNGIAQGYITDRITDLLKSAGIEHTLVDMGEMMAMGTHPGGKPWEIGIRDPLAQEKIAFTLPLADRALATSGGYGRRFSATAHHLFDPKTGLSANHYASLSVLSPSAAIADALSTGLFALSFAQASAVVRSLPNTRAFALMPDGTHENI